jgi:hypothetical protein
MPRGFCALATSLLGQIWKIFSRKNEFSRASFVSASHALVLGLGTSLQIFQFVSHMPIT